MLLMFSAALPLFVRVTVRAALEAATCWPGNAKLVGVRVAIGREPADPVPDRLVV
jgi:hypothetical protein